MLFRYINGAMVLILFVAAVIQYNDPDSLGWMLVYGLAAVISAAYERLGKAKMAASAAAGAVALIWAVMLVPQVGAGFGAGDLVRSMQADEPRIEIAREICGLLIVVVWMTVLTTRAAVDQRAASPTAHTERQL